MDYKTYDMEWLLSLKNGGTSQKFVYFWGHRKRTDKAITKACFSQWWEQSFLVEGKEYKTAEHWMMAGKAKLFNDQEILEKIILAKTPGEAKALGRKVRNFDNTTWEAHRYEIVKQGNLHKFSQHEDLKEFLLNTGD